VAELVGVEPHVLRYWEREFRSIRPTKSAKGQRVYSRRDVENLMRVRQLLYSEGFTIAGAKKKLQRTGVEADGETQGEAEAAAEGDGEPAATAGDPSKTREQLLSMRREIEAFLGELGPPRR
jgi:DNA-binding transcriptional MerR regulator